MFWCDKKNPNVTYMGNRVLHTTLSGGRNSDIKLDVIGDFRDIPFPDNSFHQVVFDSSHLIHAGKNSWLIKKYGVLNEDTWKNDLR